jgi:endonuclease/exonuclease/phosphatase family metal-dependent hydrolase
MKQLLNIPKWLLWTFSAVWMSWLLMAYFAYWVPVHMSSWLPFVGLAFPFLYLGGIVLMLGWMIFAFKKSWWVMAIVLLGSPFVGGYYQWGMPDDVESKSDLKIMSWNVNLMGLNRRNKQVKMDDLAIRDSMFQVMKSAKPDVIAFQEFFQSDEFDHIGMVKKELSLPYHHVKFSMAKSGGRKSGVALFSKYPILKSGYVPFTGDTHNFCIYIDVLKDADTLRIYNVHLQSIRFKSEDYATIQEEQEEVDGYWRILRLMRKAFVKREGQVHTVKLHAATCPYPYWIVGDFNDPPQSYAYHKMSSGMEDAYREAGEGISPTYAGKFPNFRIDYILGPEERYHTVQYHVYPVELVDHRPIVAGFSRKE